MNNRSTFDPESIINPIAIYVYSCYKTQLGKHLDEINQQLNNKILNKNYWSDTKLLEHFKKLELSNMLNEYDKNIYEKLKTKLVIEDDIDMQLNDYDEHIKQYKINNELYEIDDNILEIFEVMRKQDLIMNKFIFSAQKIGTNFKPENIFKIENECNAKVFKSIYLKHIGNLVSNVNLKENMKWYRDWKMSYKEYRLIFNRINLANFIGIYEIINIEEVQKKFNEYISLYSNTFDDSLEFNAIEFNEKEIKKHIIVYLIYFLRNYFLHNSYKDFVLLYIEMAKKMNNICISNVHIPDNIVIMRSWYLLKGKNRDWKNALKHTKWDNAKIFSLDKEIQHEYYFNIYNFK